MNVQTPVLLRSLTLQRRGSVEVFICENAKFVLSVVKIIFPTHFRADVAVALMFS